MFIVLNIIKSQACFLNPGLTLCLSQLLWKKEEKPTQTQPKLQKYMKSLQQKWWAFLIRDTEWRVVLSLKSRLDHPSQLMLLTLETEGNLEKGTEVSQFGSLPWK